MNTRNATRLSLVATASVLTLAACGGGGDSSTPTTPITASEAQGLWVGTTNTNRTVTGLVLDDGTYYVLYSQVGNPLTVAGVVQGHGSANNGSFTSVDAHDFYIEDNQVLPATISASYLARQSLGGTVMYTAGGAITFATIYDSAYELTPSLTALAGTFVGQVALSVVGAETATVTVSSSGAVSGVGQSGCTFTGTASPRTTGNAFNLSITFGGSPCYFANQTFTGIAYYDGDPAAKRLYAAAPNATRTDGVLFIGVKP